MGFRQIEAPEYTSPLYANDQFEESWEIDAQRNNRWCLGQGLGSYNCNLYFRKDTHIVAKSPKIADNKVYFFTGDGEFLIALTHCNKADAEEGKQFFQERGYWNDGQ